MSNSWGEVTVVFSVQTVSAPAPPVIYDLEVPLQIHLQAHIAMWTLSSTYFNLNFKLWISHNKTDIC